MNDLIKALQILAKYCDATEYAPTHCEHDVLMVPGIDAESVSVEDKQELEKLGFVPNEESYGFCSHRFGSC